MCLATLRTHKIFKRKKKKKKKVISQVEVSRKASFFKKILPGFYDKVVRKYGFDLKQMFKRNENVGWRFYWKPVGLELSFLETGAYLYFLFIYFFIFFVTDRFLMKWDQKMLIRKMEVLQKGYEILKQKKEM